MPLTAYGWKHFTLEFQRTWDDKVFFIDVIINGQRYYFNRTFLPKYNVNASEINVAVQRDANSVARNYSIWVDKVSLTYW